MFYQYIICFHKIDAKQLKSRLLVFEIVAIRPFVMTLISKIFNRLDSRKIRTSLFLDFSKTPERQVVPTGGRNSRQMHRCKLVGGSHSIAAKLSPRPRTFVYVIRIVANARFSTSYPQRCEVSKGIFM